MIFISIEDSVLGNKIVSKIAELGVEVRYIKPNKQSYLGLYKGRVSGVVVDNNHPTLPREAWSDMLGSLAKRVPVLVINSQDSKAPNLHIEAIFNLHKPQVDDVVSTLDYAGALGRRGSVVTHQNIALYDPKIPLQMLEKNKSLSVLAINAQDFQQVATEYGNEAYLKLTAFFEKILFSLWGAAGSFRAGDILCKKSNSSNTYYIFLELSRSMQDIPLPGALEKLADRLALNLQHLLWRELYKRKGERELPDCLSTLPIFSVGYASKIANPCVRANESLDSLIDAVHLSAKVQEQRINAREAELLQSLIRYDGMLTPAFQAVFNANSLSVEDVERANREGSIGHMRDSIYGFESLIRVDHQYVNKLIDQDGPVYLEAKYLNPDVLFDLAAKTRLSLELDQACIVVGSRFGAALPGRLLVNILPRNLYYIDQLQHLIPDNMEIIFELSESEAINNFELLLKVRDNLSKMNLGIAADDFGKGYAGLERVIKVKPDLIKLDRILIQDIQDEPGKVAFVKGLVEAARTSNSIILAEGVETIEEFRVCKSLGVDLMQGFLFHRPSSIDLILEDFAKHEKLSEIDNAEEELSNVASIKKVGGAA